ncbi:MAG TPA: DnaA/Hda family protein, partial [Gemmatimonadaceae bacterium]|nr:DnaA/Hda family protein [Gemmatimonadaceae bacterium]
MDRDTRYRFENFVIGAANRLAVAAARAVAQSPATAYNPLFIYAGSGLGKTHLLVACGQLAQQLQPQLTVSYAIVDELVEQLHTAVSMGEIEGFRQRYQSLDMLLLDDVQFLAGRRETQTEILRLFNVLQRSGRQIVLASDRPPAEISDLDERLITRFSGGLIVDIGAPDYETRAAILRRKVAERELQFAPGVVEEVARLPFSNVRELQGALNRLIASQTLGEQQVTVANVHALLGDGVRTGDYEAIVSSEPPPTEGDEFASFLSELADAVAVNIEPWRVRVGEAVTRWHAAGYRTGELDRALASDEEPDVDALLARFHASVERLRQLAGEAAALDERSA